MTTTKRRASMEDGLDRRFDGQGGDAGDLHVQTLSLRQGVGRTDRGDRQQLHEEGRRRHSDQRQRSPPSTRKTASPRCRPAPGAAACRFLTSSTRPRRSRASSAPASRRSVSVRTARASWSYHGAIDDNHKEPDKVQKRYLKDALDAVVAGKPPVTPESKSIGCGIKFRKA